MTESRKIQLETEVVANTDGFQQIQQAAQQTATVVQQAGEKASTGLAKIGDGTKRAADSMARESGRLRSEIQRVTLEMQSLGKTASEKFELKIATKGLDAAQFAPAIAQLKELERARAAIAAQQVKDTFIGDLRGQIASLREAAKLQEMTADQALRYQAAQAGASGETAHLITQLTNMRAAQEAAAAAAQRQAAAQREAAAAAKGRESFLGSLRAEADSIGKTRSDLLELKAAQLGVSKEAEAYIAKLRKVEAGQAAVGMSARQTAAALRGVPAQFTDIVTSLASGQNPMIVILQQGGQLKDMFGGIGNAVRAVTSLITPMTAGIGVAVAALGGLAFALSRVESEARSLNTLQAQLSATSRGGLFSTDELKKFIQELSLAPGVTRGVATQVVSELSKVREIGPGLFRDLSRAAVDYAKATGMEVPAAARALAKAFSDPAKGAKELDDALGSLSSTQLLTVERLAKQGDIAGAQRALFDALQGSIKGLADNAMTPLQRSTNELGNAWERAMRQLDQSEGLRTLNSLLAKTVDAVRFLVDNAPKVGGLGTLGMASIPGLQAPAVGNAVGSGVRSLLGSQTPPTTRREVVGRVTELATGAPASPATTSSKDADEAIKRALEAGKAYQSEAGKLAELEQQRKTFNAALTQSIALYGKESEQAKKLREAIAGVNERIAAAGQKGGREGDQTRQAALEAELARFRDALQEERDALAFHERQLQNQYQAGAISLTDYYGRRVEAIRAGAQAAIDEMEREKARIAQDRDFFAKRDPSRATQLQGRIDDISREQEKTGRRAEREVELANAAQAESFRQLSDEVTNYRANLLQLQGDEAGAARLRAQQAIEQARRLAKRSEGSPTPISQEDQAATEQAIRNATLLTEARRQSGIVSNALALEEERIAMAQRAGAITSMEAMAQAGEARKRVIAQLEEIVRAQEDVAAQAGNSENWQLKLDTAQARQQLEKLKEEMDPLAEHFRSLFTDATGNLFADLANDPKNAKQALNRFFGGIASDLNREFGQSLATKLFGKEGMFGNLPGQVGEIFGKGGKPAQVPLVDTAPLSGSLAALKASGADPLTASFQQMRAVIDQIVAKAGAAPGASGAGGLPAPASGATTGDFARFDRGQTTSQPLTTGDFARMDRGQSAAQEQVDAATKDAGKSAQQLAESTGNAAASVLQLAASAARGNDALSLMPQIIATIQAIATANAAGGGGGAGGGSGILGTLLNVGMAYFSGGASGATAAFSQTAAGSSGFGTGLAYGNQDYGLFLHEGGMVGRDEDVRRTTGLKPNEVPAILMGGPKGVREEVLTADDPRHADNLNPAMKRLIDRMPRYHDGGIVGEKSYQAPSMNYLTAPAAPARARDGGTDSAPKGGTYIVQVTASPGMSREQAMNQGRDIQRGMQIQAARRSRNS